MSKVKQILQLYARGVNKTMIVRHTGVSRNTIKRFIRQFIAMNTDIEVILEMRDGDLELLFKAQPSRFKSLWRFWAPAS